MSSPKQRSDTLCEHRIKGWLMDKSISCLLLHHLCSLDIIVVYIFWLVPSSASVISVLHESPLASLTEEVSLSLSLFEVPLKSLEITLSIIQTSSSCFSKNKSWRDLFPSKFPSFLTEFQFSCRVVGITLENSLRKTKDFQAMKPRNRLYSASSFERSIVVFQLKKKHYWDTSSSRVIKNHYNRGRQRLSIPLLLLFVITILVIKTTVSWILVLLSSLAIESIMRERERSSVCISCL